MRELAADLHMHSVWSDGAYSPAELAARCARAGLGLISLTDHDTMGGSEEGRSAAERYGLRFVRGWEVSAYDGETKVHILGYGCEENGAYSEFCERRREGALVRAEDMLGKANACFGLHLTREDVERQRLEESAPIHTMHVVRAFAEALQKDQATLYRDVFARGGPAFSALCRPTPEEAIEAIHACGGIAVLAHPGRIEPAERKRLLLRLSDGLDGIECHYPTHTVTDTEQFLAFARERGLAVTGGSDFHVEDGFHELGKPPFLAEEDLLEALRVEGGIR